jgi:hypothetical protein
VSLNGPFVQNGREFLQVENPARSGANKGGASKPQVEKRIIFPVNDSDCSRENTFSSHQNGSLIRAPDATGDMTDNAKGFRAPDSLDF